jgi:hypothetical protein
MLLPKFLHHRRGGVIRPAYGEQDFERWIILFEKRAQVGFQVAIESGERLENADRNGMAESGRLYVAIADGRDDRQNRVDRGAGDQCRKNDG